MRAPGEKQTPYFGRQTKDTFNASELEGGTALGQRFTVDGVTYQVVKVRTASADLVADEVCWWSDLDAFEVTKAVADSFDGNSSLSSAAGIATVAADGGNYTCIRIAGLMNAKVTNAVAAGSALKPKAADNTLDIAAAADIFNAVGTSVVLADGTAKQCWLQFPVNQ